jgi:putative transposase
MLEYKANRLVEVEPAYTCIICSRCGNKVPKTLAVRTHRCDKCGLVIDRDYNSGLNILQKGLLSSSSSLLSSSSSSPLHILLSLLPVERREVTPVEIPPARRESLKQEEAHVFKRG